MADSTTFSEGNEFPLFAPESPPRLPGAADRQNIDSLREKVREIGVDLKRNWVEQPASGPQARRAAQAPDDAPDSSDWAQRLAEEYRADIAPRQLASKSSVPSPVAEPEEKHVWADRAYASGRLLFAAAAAAGPVLAPVVAFIGARSRLVLQILLSVLLLLAVQGLLRDWPASPAVAPAPRAAWLDISKPYPLFEISAPALGRDKPVYSARRQSSGGGREDVLTFNQFGGKKTYLQFGVYRHGSEDATSVAYFVDMARRAAAAGLAVTQAELPQALPTRFGVFESAPLELAAAGLKRKNCRGFRLEAMQPALTLGGLACGGAEESFSASDAACLINRLDLLAAGQDQALAEFFGVAQGKTGRGCVDGGKRK